MYDWGLYDVLVVDDVVKFLGLGCIDQSVGYCFVVEGCDVVFMN